ncbi:unnamed protein product, partial [Mesorhabditis spiculigera]
MKGSAADPEKPARTWATMAKSGIVCRDPAGARVFLYFCRFQYAVFHCHPGYSKSRRRRPNSSRCRI